MDISLSRSILPFRLGKIQLYSARSRTSMGKCNPGNLQGFITAAGMANGRACIPPMKSHGGACGRAC